MFYLLSKTLDVVLSPLCWSLLALLSAYLFWRKKRERWARLAVLVAGLLLSFFSTGWVAGGLWKLVSHPNVPLGQPDERFDAVVLLGGFAGAPRRGADFPEFSGAVDRMFKALELYRRQQAPRILISAGAAAGPPEADFVAAALVKLGVPREDLLLERGSINTRQNALGTLALAQERGLSRLAIVTSASHAQRAYECFRAVGLEVKVFLSDFEGLADSGALLPRARHLQRSEQALRSIFGLWVYRLAGYAAW